MGLHMLVRVTILILLLTLMATGLTGCWDLTEPNQLFYIMGSGIDKSDDGKIELSLQVPLPNQQGSNQGKGGGNPKQFVVVSGKGKNIFDAASHIVEKSSRKLFGGHRFVVVINEEVAKQGFTQWLDELIRHPDNNTRARLFIVKGITAKGFLETQYKVEKYSSLSAYQASTLIGYNNLLYEFQRDINNPVNYTILPVIESVTNNKEYEYNMHSIAILNKEHKLMTYMKDREATSALWAAGKLHHTFITHYISQGDGTISVDLRKIQRQVKLNIKGRVPSIHIKLSGKGIYTENNTNLDLLSPSVKESVTKEMSKRIQDDVRVVFDKVQKKYKSDIFGFGNEIARKHPDKWNNFKKNWDETFSKMDVTVEVNLSIQGGGLIGSGPKIAK